MQPEPIFWLAALSRRIRSFASGIQSEEARNGIRQARPNIWIGNTSRDEYVGVMFGLGVAYDFAGSAFQNDIEL
jgi:hypothetical protein